MKTKKYTLPIIVVSFAIIAFATVAFVVSVSDPAEPSEQIISISDMEYKTTAELPEAIAREEIVSLISVSRDDEWRFTPEEWAEILEKIELGEIYWED